MKIVTLDFETYFDSKSFTLKRMTNEEYVRDPRFEPHCCGFRWPNGCTDWFEKETLKSVFERERQLLETSAILCHHSQFDGLILNELYDIRPAAWLCTMSMGRGWLPAWKPKSLDGLRAHYGLPAKRTPYNLFDGKHWEEITPAAQEQIGEGAVDECLSIYDIFTRFMKEGFPAEELPVIDNTIRMFTEPMLQADVEFLGQLWIDEENHKLDLFEALGVTREQISGEASFIELLETEGVEVEYKRGKRGLIPCFAKTDEFMRGLLEDPNDVVRMLAMARLGVRSTINQTRAERIGEMMNRGGDLPIYVSYCGAHTTRWAGGDSVNWQNMPRVRYDDSAPL